MTKSPRENIPDVGIKLRAACMPSERASDPATTPGYSAQFSTSNFAGSRLSEGFLSQEMEERRKDWIDKLEKTETKLRKKLKIQAALTRKHAFLCKTELMI